MRAPRRLPSRTEATTAARHPRATREPQPTGMSLWATIRAVFGAALGVLPHLAHHVSLLAGTAVLTGVLGNTFLYAVGLALSVPMLRRLGRRFGSRVAPGLGIVAFTGLFALSAFVIGPAISGSRTAPAAPAPTQSTPTDDPGGHTDHPE